MKKIIPILIIVILLVAVVYAVIVDLKEAEKMDVGEESIIEENRNFSNNIGYIEGSLYSWSEVLPIGLYVCAKNINTQYYYCTDESFNDSKFKFGRGYRLEVPVGLYQVAGLYPSSLINSEEIREFKSVPEHCNKNDKRCPTTLNTIKVLSDELSMADLNSKGELDLFKIFDLKQYPNYIK